MCAKQIPILFLLEIWFAIQLSKCIEIKKNEQQCGKLVTDRYGNKYYVELKFKVKWFLFG